MAVDHLGGPAGRLLAPACMATSADVLGGIVSSDSGASPTNVLATLMASGTSSSSTPEASVKSMAATPQLDTDQCARRSVRARVPSLKFVHAVQFGVDEYFDSVKDVVAPTRRSKRPTSADALPAIDQPREVCSILSLHTGYLAVLRGVSAL